MMQKQGAGQSGMTLIEVLVALLILSVGALGAAAVQLNALKLTDSALRNTEASFIAHDMLERIRANPQANYSLGSLSQAPTTGNLDDPRQQDLFDFASNLKRMGEGAEGRISLANNAVTIQIEWSDARGAQQDGHRETFMLTSTVSADTSIIP
jgi:type IV pilus assembly protein PilV